MSTPNIASPPGPMPFPSNEQDSTFDFLSFMGIDASSTSPYSTTDNAPSKGRDDDEARGGSSRGRTKARSIRGRGDRSTSGNREGLMEIDTSNSSGGSIVPFTPSQMLGMSKGPAGGMEFGFGGSIGHDFDAAQAQLLQQQVSCLPLSPLEAMLSRSSSITTCNHPSHSSSITRNHHTTR